jgi:hypothetical protein
MLLVEKSRKKALFFGLDVVGKICYSFVVDLRKTGNHGS